MLRSMMNVMRSGIGAAGAELVRGAADRDEVARLEQGERLGVGDPLAASALLEDPSVDAAARVDGGHQTVASAPTKRSSGTSSSSPTSWASSRNV